MSSHLPETSRYRKTLNQIIKEQKDKTEEELMNPSQRIELGRLYIAAEIGSKCIDNMGLLLQALEAPGLQPDAGDVRPLINDLKELYEVGK